MLSSVSRSSWDLIQTCGPVQADSYIPLRVPWPSTGTLQTSTLTFPAFASWALYEINNLPSLFTTLFFPHSPLLCLWSGRPSFPGSWYHWTYFSGLFVTPNQLLTCSAENQKTFLGQHPVFVKLLCRVTAVKEACCWLIWLAMKLLFFFFKLDLLR